MSSFITRMWSFNTMIRQRTRHIGHRCDTRQYTVPRPHGPGTCVGFHACRTAQIIAHTERGAGAKRSILLSQYCGV